MTPISRRNMLRGLGVAMGLPFLDAMVPGTVLNAGDQDAHILVTLFFKDREPVGPYRLTVSARRTLHLRFNDLVDPAIPRGVDYSSTIESDVPIVVQHTRLDSRQSANALLSTIAFAAD